MGRSKTEIFQLLEGANVDEDAWMDGQMIDKKWRTESLRSLVCMLFHHSPCHALTRQRDYATISVRWLGIFYGHRAHQDNVNKVHPINWETDSKSKKS